MGQPLEKVDVKVTFSFADCLKVMTHLTDTFAQQTPVAGRPQNAKTDTPAPLGEPCRLAAETQHSLGEVSRSTQPWVGTRSVGPEAEGALRILGRSGILVSHFSPSGESVVLGHLPGSPT